MHTFLHKITTIFLSLTLLGVQPGLLTAAEALRVERLNITVNGTDAVIEWATNKSASACVEFGEGKNYGFKTCVNQPNDRTHSIELANLRPETWYNYRVVSEAGVERVESLNNSFKTGETIDRDVPRISDVRLEYVGSDIAFATWITDEPTSSRIEYGIERVDERRVTESRRVEEHGMKIKNLKQNTTYFYRIVAIDEAGNESRTIPRSFKTYHSADIDNNPPRFLSVSPLVATDPGVRETTAQITWTTSRPASATIKYGVKPDRLNKRITVQQLRRTHSVELTDLEPGTQYYYRITMKDLTGQTAVAPSKDASYTFVTRGSANTTRAPQTNTVPAQRTTTQKIKETVKRIPQVLGAQTENTPQTPTSFTPERTTPSQRLYKPMHGAYIYTIISGKRHRITSPESFESYGYKWEDVRIIHETELEKYPIARLVKEPGNPSVFYVYSEKNIKVEIPTSEVFTSYPSNRWEDVITISHQDIDSYRSAKLISLGEGRTVYYLHNSVIRPIVDEEAFERYNLSRDDIVTVNATHLKAYRVGDVLR